MEKPGWLPLISGALPSGASDLSAIMIVGIAALNAALGSTILVGHDIRPWLLVISVGLACSLAARSSSERRLKEELALFAYGSSAWVVGLRGFLRGLACSLVALSPYLVLEADPRLFTSPLEVAYVALGVGGFCYALPALVRTRSVRFVENYKG